VGNSSFKIKQVSEKWKRTKFAFISFDSPTSMVEGEASVHKGFD